jgi:hypothetical protein
MKQSLEAKLGTCLPVATAEDDRSGAQLFQPLITFSSHDVAQYIAELVLDLRNMTNPDKHKALRDLLELCFYEASYAACHSETATNNSEKPLASLKARAA